MTNIASTLEQHAVAIELLQTHPKNARLGDVEAIKESLQRFGQVRPILVQSTTGFVVAGNHTMKAARELGWEKIAAIAVDLDEDEALAYLIADNRLGDRGGYDDALLNEALEQLMLTGRLSGTGFSPDDVDDRLAAMDALPEVEPEAFEGGHAVDDEALAERFANRSQVALRQFVLMYEQDTASEVEGMFRKLERAWGMSGARDVVLEALRRASAEPPVEGLTVEEAERANIQPEAPGPLPEESPVPEVPQPEDLPEPDSVEGQPVPEVPRA